jgi:hypothetical protein
MIPMISSVLVIVVAVAGIVVLNAIEPDGSTGRP